MALTTKIAVALNALQTASNDVASDISAPHNLQFAATWLSGTAVDQADLVWGDTRTLAASATEDLDLAGSLAGSLGGTLTFARIKAIMVLAHSGNTNNVVVGGAATNTWVGPFGAATHTHSVQPNGFYAAATPSATAWPVTATTGDLLKIANSTGGTQVIYTIFLVGASA